VGYIAYPGKQLLREAGVDTRLEEQLLKVGAGGASNKENTSTNV
jgi:hypothetical protein